MAAYDQRSYTISGAGSPPSMKLPWFLPAQTVAGWGTTPNMGTVTTYRMRAHDSGSGGRYVYWTSTATPDTSPSADDTTPGFTGVLTNPAIIGTG